MPPLPTPALHALATSIQSILAPTRYACTSLTQLTGGTTSFVFLGTLITPLAHTYPSGEQTTEESVIVKHAAPFASCHTSFPVDAARAGYEAAMLEALRGFAPGGAAAEIGVPEMHWYDAAERVLVLQYISSTTPLSKSLETLSEEQAGWIGRALGTWLRGFHAWCEESAQRGLKTVMEVNGEEVELKWKLTWGQGTEVVDGMGDVVGEAERGAWDAARTAAWEGRDRERKGVVHGDFWAGNILIPNPLPIEPNTSPTLHLHIIDFEFSHSAPHPTDLSHFLGDLLERYYIAASPPPSIFPLLTSFLATYRPLTDEMKWATVVGVGVHVVNWWSRGPPGRRDVDAATRGRGAELVERGVRWVKGGLEREESVFLDELLGVLFKG